MTTRVIVKSPHGNHLAVKVEPVNPETGTPNGYPSAVLGHGQEYSAYVHSSSMLRVTEVPLSEATAGVANVDFGSALDALKCGKKVTRSGWNGKGMWLELQRPDANSKMTAPYVYLSYPADAANTPGARFPWQPSQGDLMANDWAVL